MRNDFCLLIWDIESSVRHEDGQGQAQGHVSTKPIAQYGSSEAVASASWFYGMNTPCIVAGMGGKWIRAYDLRSKCS